MAPSPSEGIEAARSRSAWGARLLKIINPISINVVAALLVLLAWGPVAAFLLIGAGSRLHWIYLVFSLISVVGIPNFTFFKFYRPLLLHQQRKMANVVFVGAVVIGVALPAMVGACIRFYSEAEFAKREAEKHYDRSALDRQTREAYAILHQHRPEYANDNLGPVDVVVSFYVVKDFGVVNHMLWLPPSRTKATTFKSLTFSDGPLELDTDRDILATCKRHDGLDTCEVNTRLLSAESFFTYLVEVAIPLSQGETVTVSKTVCWRKAVWRSLDGFIVDMAMFGDAIGRARVQVFSDVPITPMFGVVRAGEGGAVRCEYMAYDQVSRILEIEESARQRGVREGYEVSLQGGDLDEVIIVEFMRPLMAETGTI